MSDKGKALHIIEALPEGASFDDIMEALYVMMKFQYGEAQIQAGSGISHEDAKQRLSRWLE